MPLEDHCSNLTRLRPPGGPSSTDALLCSIRRWLSVIAFLVGRGVVALAATGYEVTGAQEGALFAAVGVSGGVVALLAGLTCSGCSPPRSRATAALPRDADEK